MNKSYCGAAILDADGVALDTAAIHEEIGRQCAVEFGIKDFDIHSQDIRKIFLRLKYPPEAYQRYLEIFSSREKERGVRVFPFVNWVLRALRRRGLMTGIFSNRKMRAHNHEMFFNSGLDYGLLDFFMMPSPSDPESEVCPKSLHPIYIATNFSKPCGFAAFPLYELIQEIPGAPQSVCYVGDNAIDHDFAKHSNFSFKGVLSGVIRSSDEWLKLGVKADAIMPDIRNLLDPLPLPPLAGRP